jgi:hypothetical protein
VQKRRAQTGELKRRRRTGERPEAKQPLKIDRLPEGVRAQIEQQRAKGKTWLEIEELSDIKNAGCFVAWSELKPDVLELFPDCRLPHSNLHRWYDLRVDQVRRDVLARTETAREFAEAFAGREFKGVDQAVMNALRDQVFSLVETAGDEAKFYKALNEFGWLVAQFKNIEIKKQRADAETKRIGLLAEELKSKSEKLERATEAAANKLGKGRSLTLDDINKIRERTFGLPAIGGSDAA